MTGVLVDTNMVSGLTRETPESRVLVFRVGHDNLWLSALVLHELDFGVGLFPPGRHTLRVVGTCNRE